MIPINGTLPLSVLAFPLSKSEIDTYYSMHMKLLDVAANGKDVDLLCFPEQTIVELEH